MKYTLICPKCKHELNYDSDYYDRTITRLGCEISDIIKQRAEHKLLPYQVQRQKDDWWRRSKRALAEKQKELAELKAVRKVANEQVDRTKEGIFRNLVKEEIGLEMYLKLTKQAEKELEAYNVADLSKHVFTTNKKPVVSVNKL